MLWFKKLTVNIKFLLTKFNCGFIILLNKCNGVILMRALDYVDKNRKLVKFLRILSQIGLWGSGAAVVIFLPLAVYLASGNGADLFMNLPETFNFGYTEGAINFNIGLDDISPQVAQTIIVQLLFTIVIYAAVFGCILFYLSGVLKAVENRSPFARENSRRISSMGVVFFAGSVITGLMQAATAHALIVALGLGETMSVDFSFNSTMLMTGLLLLILSGIFRYGTYLQEEYDATL
jgi:hypothetical protein